jgi:hypothetical protein
MEKLKLPNVTLITICGTMKHVPISKVSLHHCMKHVDFGDVILFSTEEDKEFKTTKIPRLDFCMYNQFCVEELVKHIKTDYVLIVQEDSSIIGPEFWTDDFFNFDYIGSPWPMYNFRVGNGGFSLRSKKFLETTAKMKYTGDAHLKAGFSANQFSQGSSTPEDFYLCYIKQKELEDDGVKFADPITAYQFAVEYQGRGYLEGQEDKGEWVIKTFHPMKVETYNSFGFHGRFNVGGMKELLKTKIEIYGKEKLSNIPSITQIRMENKWT